MYTAHCLKVLYICEKFHENISNGIRVMESTQKMGKLTDGWMDTQNFGWYIIIPSPFFVAGHKNDMTTC